MIVHPRPVEPRPVEQRPGARPVASARRPLLPLVAVLLLAAALFAVLITAVPRQGGRGVSSTPEQAVPAPLPNIDPAALTSAPAALRPVDAQTAMQINAAMPVSDLPNPPAASLLVPLGDGVGYLRALDCMTAALYYEAATQGADGQRAVAQVVLNRVRDPAYPSTVCGVVYEGHERATGCQFSFTCDGSLLRAPIPALWARAKVIASGALAGRIYAPVGLATHYHADYVAPRWAPTLVKLAQVGAHIFYRWPGARGEPRAFTQRYGGIEQAPDDVVAALNTALGAPEGADGAAALPSERFVLGQDANASIPSSGDTSGTTAGGASPPSPGGALPERRWVLTDMNASGAPPRTPAPGATATAAPPK